MTMYVSAAVGWLVVASFQGTAVGFAASPVDAATHTGRPVREGARAGRQPADVSFEARAAAAAAARDAGRIDEALGAYRRLTDERPDWLEGHWYVGSLLYELARPREARHAFAEVLRLAPGHAGAQAMSGLCAFDLGLHADALHELLAAMRLNVEQTPEIGRVVRFHAGMLFTRFGEFEAGNQLLTSVASDAEETPLLREALGANLLRLPVLPGEVSAEEQPRVALAGQVGYAMARRDAAAAQALLEQLVARFGGTPEVHYVWGVFLAAADPPAAIAAWRRELEISPGHVPARLQLVGEYLKLGAVEEARRHAEEAVQRDPQGFASYLALGRVHLAADAPAAAVTAFAQAVTLAPESAQAHYLLAMAYQRAGRTDEAAAERAIFERLSASPAMRPPP